MSSRLEALHRCDLAFLGEQLVWKDGLLEEEAKECVEEYRKWIGLHLVTHDAEFRKEHLVGGRTTLGMPSRHIDNVWHRHILFTKEYTRFCHAVAGRMIHHNPCTRRNVARMKSDVTRKVYEVLFGDMPAVWEAPEAFVSANSDVGCGCGCDNRD